MARLSSVTIFQIFYMLCMLTPLSTSKTSKRCSQLEEVGNCDDYTLKYFYDKHVGRCRPFWYGGCNGNDNRFDTLIMCQNVCTPNILPSTREFKITNRESAGANRKERTDQEEANNIIPSTVSDPCQFPNDRGPCANYTIKWFFNPKENDCLRFWYGDCGGNDNRFDDRDSCRNRCLKKSLKPVQTVLGCQGSTYGCCSDGVTYSRGPAGAGCPENRVGGCAGTRYGCCADRKTSAEGPNREGCSERRLIGGCAGTRYGCCADGQTAARGENRLGCDENPSMSCRSTRYGCCADGVTAATGLNRQGCPEQETESEVWKCDNSRYGCCPDGVSAAAGPNEEGCRPFDPVWCGQPKDPGTCTEYTLSWFYETEFGMCRQFWYGSCGGNGNKFSTKDECEAKCVNVEGPDACRLPMITGPCKASKERYFFNTDSGKCEQFAYGGCKGNTNNFDTMSECLAKCSGHAGSGHKSEILLSCASYPCKNGFSCQDNHNGSYSCSCNPDWGQNCSGPPGYWCFSDDECGKGLKCVQERRCASGYCSIFARCAAATKQYACDTGRCPRNQDCVNDDSFEDGYFCQNKINYVRPFNIVLGCDKSEHGCCPDQSTPATGPHYHGCQQSCQESDFGCCLDGVTSAEGPDYEGCELGSGYQSCEVSEFGCCEDGVTSATGAGKMGCGDMQNRIISGEKEGPRSKIGNCKAPMTRELCTEFTVKWKFNDEKQKCDRGWWGGCEDNGNVFESQESCEAECMSNSIVITNPGNEDPDFINICDMPVEEGPCDRYLLRYYYDPRERSCVSFTYGGCRGNENNFISLEDCQKECMGGIINTITTTQVPVHETVPPPTREIELTMSGDQTVMEGDQLRITCQATGPFQVQLQWFINRQPVNSEMGEVQLKDRSTVTSVGYEQVGELIIPRTKLKDNGSYLCRSSNGQMKSLQITVEPTVNGRTTTVTPMDTENTIVMTGQPNPKRGETITITCRAVGDNRPTEIEWFINGEFINTNQDNPSVHVYDAPETRNALISELTIKNIDSSHDGTYYCRSRPDRKLDMMVISVMEKEAEVPEQENPQVVCRMEKAVGDCTSSVTRWYYDPHNGACVSFTYNGCGGNRNNFENMEQCNNFCSAQEICLKAKETGPCRAAMPRFYFNSDTGSCESFIYGGCRGNLNNFASREACDRKCASYKQTVSNGNTYRPTPGSNENRNRAICSLSPDKGTCDGYNVKWYYSAARNRCARFIYTGCDGNGNRFNSEDECNTKCLKDEAVVNRRKPRPRPTSRPVPVTELSTLSHKSTCSMPKDRGSCAEYVIKWHYDASRQRCVRFWYGGCDGNGNRFDGKEECERRCVHKEETTSRPETASEYTGQCHKTRYGCCNDGITTAADPLKSNCYDDNVIVQPGTTEDHTLIFVRSGTDAFLRCTIRGQAILWYRDGFLLQSSQRFQVFRNGTLALRRVYEDMAGIYACRTSYGNNIPQLQRFKVEVNVPLSILPGPGLMSIRPGDTAFVHCQAVGNPQPRIFWSRYGRVLQSDNRYHVFGNGTLIINDVQVQDSGDYACSAENGIAATVKRKISLNIKETIEADIQSHQGIFMEGETIQLFCKGRGYPAPKVEWMKESQRLETSGKVEVREGELIIHTAGIDDAGMYKCVATNDRDQAEDITTVQIKFHSPQTKCEDTMKRNKCHLIVAGRLCGFRIFANKCCQTCRRAGYL